MRYNNVMFLLLLFFNSTFALTTSDGDEFTVKYNKNGAVLTPKVKTSTAGKLYLGKDCDALSKKFGKGDWSWANGGFIVEFANKRFAFPRQEVDVDNNGGCLM